ncbi:MAG: glycoside hydrolase family 3 C-terminal domain-containing protein [Clostridia bacterium]|nr:glycoside hydrolase family 3 C-terminal domain-containing protein [Clostridia bacterium]
MSRRIDDLMAKMTLEEKVAQTDMIRGVTLATKAHPAHFCAVDPSSDFDWARVEKEIGARGIGFVHDVYSEPRVLNLLQRYMVEKTRLGIPCIFTGEALHGLSYPGATSFPMPIALGAAFDPELTREVGRAIAAETRSLGIHEILAPNLDVARDPRWGRMEETFGEDTYLSSRMAEAIVSGEQGEGLDRSDAVVCEPKHYMAHGFPQGGLNCASARCGEREARSEYLPVFAAGVKKGGARNIMAAYNNIDGMPMVCSKRWLTDVLKGELGLKGYIRSDFGAVNRLHSEHHMVEDDADAVALAFNAGLDVTGFDFSNEYWQTTLCRLVREGRVPMERLDDAVRRILTVKEELGLFDHPYADEGRWQGVLRCQAHRDTCLQAARESVTLLKNDGVLPLRGDVRRVALIGPSSNVQRLGSYASVPYGYSVRSVYDELKALLPGVEIIQEDGCAISPMDCRAVPAAWLPEGVRLRFYRDGDFDETPVGEDRAACVRFNWGLAKPHPALSFSGYGVRIEGRLMPDEDFDGALILPGRDSVRLTVDGELLIDAWGEHHASPAGAPFAFRRGEAHDFRIDFLCDEGGRQVGLSYSKAGAGSLERALRAAERADVTILVCGDDTVTSGEGMDRDDLRLYGPQRELVRRAGELGKPCVLVLEVGKAVDLTEEEPLMNAILLPWFGGEMGARAIAEALTGALNPSGHLPVSFSKTVGDVPYYYSQLPGGSRDYLEGRREPRWPFGYGESYTTFALSDFTARVTDEACAEARFTVTNTGKTAGTALPQLYVEDPVSSVVTPDRRLAAFERVTLAAGESKQITWRLGPEAFRLMNEALQWVVEPGRFVLHLGFHCQDDALRAEIAL